jgi:pantoate--beta-alanine ligase
LAYSSRNNRLSPIQRETAIACALALKNAPSSVEAAEQISALGARVDYVEEWRGRRLAAFRLGEGANEVRLIDNVPLENPASHEITQLNSDKTFA